MEETGILEKTEQSDSCYLGLNQVSFRHGSKSLPSQVTIAGAGVEVAIASEPQRGGLGSGRVARRASTPATLSCNPLLNHARKEIKRPDLTLCKTGCYVKTTGHSKPATHENRVSLLGRDDSPGRPGTPISPAFSTVHLISIS